MLLWVSQVSRLINKLYIKGEIDELVFFVFLLGDSLLINETVVTLNCGFQAI